MRRGNEMRAEESREEKQRGDVIKVKIGLGYVRLG